MITIRFWAAAATVAAALAFVVLNEPSDATAEGNNGLIAYARGGGESPSFIRTVKLDGTDNRLLIGPRKSFFRLGASGPEWSHDGTKLLFGGQHRLDRPAQSLWYSTASGKRIRQIPLGLGPRGKGPRAVNLLGWGWAPDGRRVVVAARRGWTGAPMMYTISTNGKHRTALRRGWWPEWSSDGRYILFSLPPREPFPEAGRGQIAVVRPNGNGFRTLTASTHDSSPRFSPDGQRVLFVRRLWDLQEEEWRMVDVTGRHDVVVGPDGPSNLGYCSPQWTPDGTRLAVVRQDPGSEHSPVARFVTMSATGADERVAFTFSRGFFGWRTFCDFSWRPR